MIFLYKRGKTPQEVLSLHWDAEALCPTVAFLNAKGFHSGRHGYVAWDSDPVVIRLAFNCQGRAAFELYRTSVEITSLPSPFLWKGRDQQSRTVSLRLMAAFQRPVIDLTLQYVLMSDFKQGELLPFFQPVDWSGPTWPHRRRCPRHDGDEGQEVAGEWI